MSSLAIGTAAGTSATTAHPRPVLGAAFADLAAPTVADPPKAQIGQEPPFPEDAPDTTEPHKVQRYEVCTINGGRELAVQSFGAADGVPIVFMHGMPGSRIGPYPRAAALDLQGIRLIAYDRPGYGRSTRNKGRSVADAADDVESIANTLGLDQFAVVGRSGGGPHALAVAARLPHLVTAAAVLVSTAPPESPSLDWVDGMNRANAEAYTQVEDHTQLRRKLSSTVERTLKDPESFLHEWVIPQISHNDWPVIEDLEIRRQLRASYLEAFRNGVDGWFDDILALRSKWEFDVSSIVAPTLLWHGEEDTFTPVTHTHWLASEIPLSEVLVEQRGHFGAYAVLRRVFSWLTHRHLEAVHKVR